MSSSCGPVFLKHIVPAMAKWTKRILLSIGILITLLLVAAVLVPVLYKDKIEAAVKQQVNENLNATVEWGDWDISLFRNFPNARVKVQGLKVCNKAPFDGICLADIGELRATVAIMSLFSDQIKVRSLDLVKPLIHVKVLKDGTANWDITLPDSTTAELPVDTATTRFNVALKQYGITQGRIIYDDESLAYFMDLDGVEHTGKGDFTQDLFTLATKTTVQRATVAYEGVKYLRNAEADIVADIDMDMPNMKFTFKENTAKVNQLELGLNGWLAMPADDIDMDIAWEMKKSDIGALLSLIPAEFASDMQGVDMSGKAAFSGYVKGTYNEQTMPGFGLAIQVDNGRFKYPDLPASVENIHVDAHIQSPQGKDLDGMVVDIKRFAMLLAGNPLEARMHLTTPISDPNVDAAIKADLDLANVAKVVPMAKGDELTGQVKANVELAGRMSDVEAERYEKFKAQGQVALSGMNYRSDSLAWPVAIKALVLDFSPRFLALTNFTGELGKSDIQANGRFDNYLQWWLKDSTITGAFNVSSNRFDINELMGPQDEATAATPADTTPMDVIEVPKNIDFTLQASAKEVIYGDMHLTDAKGKLRVLDQKVALHDMGFNMYDGRLGMNGWYSSQEKMSPKFNMDLVVTDVDIKQLVDNMEMIRQMAPAAKYVTGRMTTSLNLAGALDGKMEPVMSSLQGMGTLKTKNVYIKEFKPLVEIANVLKKPELAQARLENLDFAYEIADGKMITKPFDVKIDRIKANVHGTTAFEDQAIDYTMKAKVPTDMFGAGANDLVGGLLGQLNQAAGSSLKAPAELDLTAKITGTVEKPVVKPVFGSTMQDIKEDIKEAVKEELNEQIGKAKEEAIAKAREEAAKLVAEAQKQADAIKERARSEAASVKGQAYKAADDLVEQAANPIAKAAAKVAADKAKKAADEKEQKFIAEADKRADGIVDAARKQGDALIEKAEATDTTVK